MQEAMLAKDNRLVVPPALQLVEKSDNVETSTTKRKHSLPVYFVVSLLLAVTISINLIAILEIAFSDQSQSPITEAAEKKTLISEPGSLYSDSNILIPTYSDGVFGRETLSISTTYNQVNTAATSTVSNEALGHGESQILHFLDYYHSGKVQLAGGTVILITVVLTLMIYELIIRGNLSRFISKRTLVKSL